MAKRKKVIKEFDHMIEKMMEIYEEYATEELHGDQADLKAMSKIIMQAHKGRDRFVAPYEKDAKYE